MGTKREKKPVYTCNTMEDLENVASLYATADAKLAKITAMMDEQITAIRNKYANELQELQDEKDEQFTEIQQFAEKNPQLFDKRKSLRITHGVIGFRTGTPKLKTVKKFTWGAVTELLKEFFPDYIRTEEVPAKDKILADRSEPYMIDLCKKCGIEVVQEESFYVELKKEGNSN